MIITYDRNNEGALVLSAFVGEGAREYLLTRTYYFHTKAQAVKLFKQEIREVNK
jgi:hypothetical protein